MIGSGGLGPADVGGAEYGRMFPEVMDPTIQTVFWLNLGLAAIVAVVVAADLIRRGRYRNISLALTRMLSGLAPLLGVYAAADCLFRALMKVAGTDPMEASMLLMSAPYGAAMVAFGAVIGAGAMTLTAILRIVPVRTPSLSAGG